MQHLELLKPWDNQIYDVELMMFSRPVNEEIVIIAVDEYSLKKLGKWPWSRRTHAELIELLTAAEVKAVGLDIIFAEQDHHDPAGDQSLIDAIRNNGRVILPVFPEKSENARTLRTSHPWPELAGAAAGLGHVDVQIDNDGIIRSAYLIAGIKGEYWPALSLALLALDKSNGLNGLPGERNPDSGFSSYAWQRDYRIEVPFSGSANHFNQVSYAEALTNPNLRAGLRSKYILVGVTAAGLSPRFSTPLHSSTGLISGVEVHANILETLLYGLSIRTLDSAWRALLTFSLVFVPVLGCHYFFFRHVFLTSLFSSALAIGLSAGLLKSLCLWYGPMPVLLVLAIHYLLWNWQHLKWMTQALFKERQLAKAALHSIADAVITTNFKGLIVYINPAAEKLTGYSLESARNLPIGSVVRLIRSEDKNCILGFDDFLHHLLNGRSIKEKEPHYIVNQSGDKYAVQVTGSPINEESGKISGLVFTLSDITDILQTSQKIAYLATHDSLTGLANRVLFHEQIEKAIASCQRQGHYLAVLFIDLDDFKKVNDGMGHAVGDSLLIEVAERLHANMRRIDTVARWGGDEFVVLLNQLPLEVNITGIIIKLLEQLSEPFYLGGLTLYVTPSIGISVFPKDGVTSEELLAHADAAMFQVKENGRNSFSFFQSSYNKSAKQRLIMEKEMYSALQEGHFEVYYQPQIDPITNRIIGAEALLRWPHPHKGFISPAILIPLAEETGLINPIGDWVIHTVCQQLNDWQTQGLAMISVAVNLSPRQFLQKELCAKIDRAIKAHDVQASSLKFEITESLMIKNIDMVSKMLWDIRKLGATISIDDFGTGYSSLSMLKNFPIDQLKIDKSFISHLDANSDDASIAQSIIMLGHNMNMNIVAEGVETQTQLDFLVKWKCDFIQGYHFSPPLPSAKMTEMLQQGEFIKCCET